jgi:hypothetical protein
MMKRLHRFIGRDLADQALLLKALVLVIGVRLGLWLLPFRVLHRMLGWLSGKRSSPRPDAEAFSEKAAWAVTAAGRYVPGATKCLVHALAVQVLLKRRGIPADLRIGVVKDEAKGLQAHAWVESRGVVVVGESGMERYTPMTPARRERDPSEASRGEKDA